MASKPIIFSAEMVRAILDNRKTQTRRPIKDGYIVALLNGEYANMDPEKRKQKIEQSSRYQVGDLLWVKEAWKTIEHYNVFRPSELNEYTPLMYLADNGTNFDTKNQGLNNPGRYRHARFMPRWASRIDLHVTGVRAELLQDISESDAMAEGIELRGGYYLGGIHPIKGTLQCWPDARTAFSKPWDLLNAKRGYSWESNPWVWVYEFEKVKP